MTSAHTAWVTEPDNELEHIRSELEQLGVAVVLDPSRDVDILIPFVHTKVDREFLDGLPNLRLIATRSTGVDHIDLQTATARGVGVANVSDYGSVAVAEYTFALLLSLTRLRAAIGTDLSGKVIGVVGTGAIGRHVIQIAHGFGMNVIAYDIEHHPGIAYVDALDDLLAQANVVTLHVPVTPATRHLIDERAIAKMKRGTILINTARGALVDTTALARALRSGHLAGAGLDVLEGSGDEEAGAPLPNAIVTPHVAYDTYEAVRRITDITIANIRTFLEEQR